MTLNDFYYMLTGFYEYFLDYKVFNLFCRNFSVLDIFLGTAVIMTVWHFVSEIFGFGGDDDYGLWG